MAYRPEDWRLWRQQRGRRTMTTKTMKYHNDPPLRSSSAFPSWCYTSLRRPPSVQSRVDAMFHVGAMLCFAVWLPSSSLTVEEDEDLGRCKYFRMRTLPMMIIFYRWRYTSSLDNGDEHDDHPAHRASDFGSTSGFSSVRPSRFDAMLRFGGHSTAFPELILCFDSAAVFASLIWPSRVDATYASLRRLFWQLKRRNPSTSLSVDNEAHFGFNNGSGGTILVLLPSFMDCLRLQNLITSNWLIDLLRHRWLQLMYFTQLYPTETTTTTTTPTIATTTTTSSSSDDPKSTAAAAPGSSIRVFVQVAKHDWLVVRIRHQRLQ